MFFQVIQVGSIPWEIHHDAVHVDVGALHEFFVVLGYRAGTQWRT